MNHKSLSNELIEFIPELENEYRKEIEYFDGKFPGNHIIFGNIVNPFLLNLLEEEKNKNLIKRFFTFFEKMADCQDENVQEVLVTTVLERLGDEKKKLNIAIEYMGQKTIKLSKKIEEGLGRV